MLTKAALSLYSVAQALWLGSHVVVISCCGLKESLYISREQHAARAVAVSSQLCVCCCILLCRIYDWAVVILVS